MTLLRGPAGRGGPSVNPMPGAGRKDASHPGSSCSAMVELALTRRQMRRSWRSAAIPASRPAATSSTLAAHSAITAPSAVRVDLDHFSSVNETAGLEAGDQVLQGIARTVTENLRGCGLVGRFGGKQFA